MKQTTLMSLLEKVEQESQPELVAAPFFRAFQADQGLNLLWKFVGASGGELIFTAPLSSLGQVSLIMSEASVVAKITKGDAVFGLVYTTFGLEQCEHTICKVKVKDGKATTTPYDKQNKKEFSAAACRFTDKLNKKK